MLDEVDSFSSVENMSPSATPPSVKVRSRFLETWIWNLTNTGYIKHLFFDRMQLFCSNTYVHVEYIIMCTRCIYVCTSNSQVGTYMIYVCLICAYTFMADNWGSGVERQTRCRTDAAFY